jgi:alanine racemase
MMSKPTRLDAPAGGRLTIDLGALVANWRTVARLSGPAQAAAVVKGDAYGTGAAQAAAALAAAGCRTFFVALPSEGAAVRAAAPSADVYVLNGFAAGAGAFHVAHRLRPVLGGSGEIADWLAETGGGGEPAALHVDTGMHRLGLAMPEAAALAADSAAIARLRPALVMSHLACADTPDHPLNARQAARFDEVRALFPSIPGSLANSAAVAGLPYLCHDLTRPGIALYGGRWSAAAAPLSAVATLEARIVQVRDVSPGETVGYGAAFAADRPARVAILAVGYADGYHRRAGDGGAVAAIGGVRVPLAGRISMDLTAVDVTGLPPGAAERGGWVELYGPTVPVDDVAAAAGTIGYELLTAMGRRFERVYRR